MRHGFFVWLIAFLSLAQLSPATAREWAYDAGSLRVVAPDSSSGITVAATTEADFNRDGLAETVILTGGRAEIRASKIQEAGGKMQSLLVTAGQAEFRAETQVHWRSPETWRVTQVAVTDLNRDGQPEAALLVWRPYQPLPIDRYLPHPGRTADFHDAAGRSCHVILIGWKRGAYREVWAGSAMSVPLLAIVAADLDGDGRQELIALDSDYADAPGSPARSLSVWEWNGFGFTLLARAPGRFRQMVVGVALDGTGRVRTQQHSLGRGPDRGGHRGAGLTRRAVAHAAGRLLAALCRLPGRSGEFPADLLRRLHSAGGSQLGAGRG